MDAIKEQANREKAELQSEILLLENQADAWQLLAIGWDEQARLYVEKQPNVFAACVRMKTRLTDEPTTIDEEIKRYLAQTPAEEPVVLTALQPRAAKAA